MTELLQTLYHYACKTQSLSSIEDAAQYQESSAVRQRNYQKLCTLLSKEEKQYMENYIGETKVLHGLELESMFLAGLSIGLELSRW